MDHGVPPQRQTDEIDQLAERIRAASDVEKAPLLVEHLAARTAEAPSAWVDEFIARVEEFAFTVPQIRRATTDLAWLARKNGRGYLTEEDRARVQAANNSRTARLCLVYIEGQRLRFDFKFAQLHRECVQWLREFEDDALVRSLAAFAALGTRSSSGLAMFHRAVNAPDADDKSNQICLTGIGFADHLPEQPRMLLDLSDEMMTRGQENEVVHYRRATAYRKLGRFDDAIDEIDRAIDDLNPGDVLVHEQFAQERRAINLARDLRTLMERSTEALGTTVTAQLDARMAEASKDLEDRLDEASRRLSERIDAAQEMVSSGLLKMVEILGIFVAIVGFVIGSGAVVLKADKFSERALSMALVITGSLLFFALLRVVTSAGRRRGRAEN